MFSRLDTVERRFEEIEAALSQDGLDPRELTRLSKERAMIQDIVVAWRAFKDLQKARDEAKTLLDDKDPGLRAMAKEELDTVGKELERAERELTVLMLPKDPNDQKNVVLEIRAGTGGEEAALFAGDLMRMYTRYASRAGWRTEILSSTTA